MRCWLLRHSVKSGVIWTSIHEANLRKKTDFKTDSFSRLFTDVLFGVFSRLPDFYRNRSFYRGSLYRSTGHLTNGPNVNGLQVNCSVHQPKLVDVWNQILTNMLYKSTALSVNHRWTMYLFGNILLYRSTKHVDLKSTFIYKMIYSSTNFFVVVVDAFTILSSLCSTGQQLFILICSTVQPTLISLLMMLSNVVFFTDPSQFIYL